MSEDKLGIRLHQTMDARIWAKEFCSLYPEADESLMLSWFANAIMVGYDTAMNWCKNEANDLTEPVKT